MLYLKRICEAKQVGTLYHICSLGACNFNLTKNSILPGEYSNVINGKKTVSFTRNKGFIVDTVDSENIFFVQFVLDGDKLSEKYKLQPYADPKYGNVENEEIIIGGVQGDLNKYLKHIILYVNQYAISELIKKGRSRFILPTFFPACESILKSGISNDVKIVSIGRSRGKTVPKIVENTPIPRDLEDLVAYIEEGMRLLDDPNMLRFSIYDYIKQDILDLGGTIFPQAEDDMSKITYIEIKFQENEPSLKSLHNVIDKVIKKAKKYITFADTIKVYNAPISYCTGSKLSGTYSSLNSIFSSKSDSVYRVEIYAVWNFVDFSYPEIRLYTEHNLYVIRFGAKE